MITVKTFPQGGIHPRDMKHLSHQSPIANASIPVVSIVPLHQHIGSPSECVVQPGSTVREGMLIGKSTGFVSSQIHSPVPGVVKEIRDIYLPSGLKSKAVVIELQGEFDRLGKPSVTRDWSSMSREKILAEIADKGVVGMGGATFPTHVKFSLPKGVAADFLIMNGAECEPYLTADHRLMLERASEVLEGLLIAAKILQPGRIVIAVENNKADAVEALRREIKASGAAVEIVELQLKYPQGDEKQLIKALTGREVPSGGLPLDIGCVASNVGTLFAIYEAVVHDKPVIERVLTVSGGAVRTPMNLKVRLGTTYADLIQECGGLREVPEKIVAGGPMMGFAVYDLDTPVTKGSSGILCLTGREIRASERTACLNCGRCIRSCPMGLHPTRLYKMIDHSAYAEALEAGLMDCRECGCCGYICPAHIPLVQGMRVGKRMARKKKGK